MTTYRGGTRVNAGYYIDARSYTFVNVERDGTLLPGTAERRYRKVPVMAAMAAAPAIGGVLVVALPFIGVGMTVYAIARKLGGAARAGATELAATVATPAALPGEAHLTGRPGGEAGEGEAEPHAPVTEGTAALEKEIEAHRGVVH